MIVREISEIEKNEWLEMRNQLWPGDDHLSEINKYFEGTIPEPSIVFISISDEGTITGHIELSIRHDSDNNIHGFIEGLYIKPEYRNAKIVNELLNTTLDWSNKNNHHSLLADRDQRLLEITSTQSFKVINKNISDNEINVQFPLNSA